jgi:hypothetical protein
VHATGIRGRLGRGPVRATRSGAAQWVCACAAAGAAVAAAIALFGPPGVDQPAHLFQTWAFAHFGFQIWSNYWYAGRYQFVTYSLLFYPVASVVGITTLAIGSAALLSGGFAALGAGRWGREARAPAMVFALSGTAVLMIFGMYPFLTGLALGMAALNAARRASRPWFALLAAASAAASPLALLMLLVALASRIVVDPVPLQLLRRYRVHGIAMVTMLSAGLAWSQMFSNGSFYAYSPSDLATVVAFSGAGIYLTGIRGRASDLRAFFILYLLLNICAFAVSSPVGSNASRMVAIAGAPLLWLAARIARRRSPAQVAAIVSLALAVQVAPALADAYTAESQPAAWPAFWVPAERFLAAHPPPVFRVEVVATWGHWESYYLAKDGVPLARGWYRQDDYPLNQVLYRGDDLTATAYVRWLHRMGVRYVLLPSGALDYTALSEAALLRSGHSGLVTIAQLPNWTVYRVPNPTPILTSTPSGSASLLRIESDAVKIQVRQPGTSLLRVRFTPYWQVPRGVCLTQAPDGMTTIVSAVTGPITLTIDTSLTAVEQAVDSDSGACQGSVANS